MKNSKSGLIVVLIIAAVTSSCASYRTTSNISSKPLPAAIVSTKVLISEDSLPNLKYKEIGSIEVSVKKLTVFHKDPTKEQTNEALAEKARAIGANAVTNVTYKRGIGLTTWGYMNANGIGVKLTDGNYFTKATLEKEFEVNEGKGYVYLKVKEKIAQPFPLQGSTEEKCLELVYLENNRPVPHQSIFVRYYDEATMKSIVRTAITEDSGIAAVTIDRDVGVQSTS